MDYPALLGECEARLREMKERADAATPGPWSVGRTLITERTRHWAPEQIRANDEVERRRAFAFFTPQDQGRGRVAVLESREPQDATFSADARTDLPALVGWALEMIEAHKRVPLGTFGARESWPTLESLALALGIMPKEGG